ncbi:MAG TPA: BON domain-containing protein [Bryobacteraceae bacterium]|jgi:hypothetical protein|nr:BON domain-containing protein [Bryobacteraceae bacterium]
MRRLLSAILVLPLFLGVLAMPSRMIAGSSAGTIQRVGNPADSQIEATIRAKLAKSKIGKDGFKFRVQRGVVTWEGTTTVMQHKGSATRMAKTAGALQVVNNIKVSAAGANTPMRKAYVKP